MAPSVHIIEAPWSEFAKQLQQIRHVVFVEEQEVPQDEEWDGEDSSSLHFIAVTELGDYIGCARLMASGQIGRMAVLQAYRGSGIGALLLDAAIDAAKARGDDRVFLHAQRHAESFYRKAGFIPYGDEFMDAGIAHIAMDLKLPFAYQPPAATPTRPAIKPQAVRDALVDGDAKKAAFKGVEPSRNALIEIIRQARRRVTIFSPYLDHELFDHPDTVAALSSMARSGARAEIKIVILSSKLIVDRGHEVVELARRLEDKISIRWLDESANADTSSFICADLDAYWLLPNFERYEGLSEQANPVRTQRLSQTFDSAWEKSRIDPELRILHL